MSESTSPDAPSGQTKDDPAAGSDPEQKPKQPPIKVKKTPGLKTMRRTQRRG